MAAEYERDLVQSLAGREKGMISRYLYVKECQYADTTLTKTEIEVLDQVTHDGWFDEREYLEAIKKADPIIHIIKNQLLIMKWLPKETDDPFIADEKNRVRQVLIDKIRKENMRRALEA